MFAQFPGNHDSLSLTAGNVDASIAEQGIIALGEAFDKGSDMGFFRSFRYGFILHLIVPQGNVVADGVIKDHIFLRDIADLFAEGFQVYLSAVLITNQDFTGCGLEDACQKIDKRGFARTGITYKGDGRFGRNGEGQVFQDRSFRIVPKGGIVKMDRKAEVGFEGSALLILKVV